MSAPAKANAAVNCNTMWQSSAKRGQWNDIFLVEQAQSVTDV
jgi:hypothetical protein